MQHENKQINTDSIPDGDLDKLTDSSSKQNILKSTYSKLTDWTKEPSVEDLKRDFDDASSDHADKVSKISGWLDNLNVTGVATHKGLPGKSRIVPKLIRKQAEWRYASLSEPFLSSDDVFNVSPVTYEDAEGAKQNELVLNNQFNTKIDKVAFIGDLVRTSVNEGVAISRVSWEYTEEEVDVEVPYLHEGPMEDPEMLEQLHELESMMEQVSPEELEAQVPPELLAMYAASVKNGEPTLLEERYRMEKQLRTTRNHPSVKVCNYKNVVIDPTCEGDIEDATFIVYSFNTSIAQLTKKGLYTNLDKVDVEGADILSRSDADINNTSSFNFKDRARKVITAREYWGYWDIHGTGLLVPILATWVGDIMVRLEESPYPDKKLPFVSVSYLPVKGSVYGEPDGELLADNQKIIGALTRGMVDIMAKNANGQRAVSKSALDITNKLRYQRGEDYEFNPDMPPASTFYTHTFPEIPSSAHDLIALQNNEAESLTGVKAFASGISGAALGNTATGIRSALDASSKRELDILRRIAKGVIEIGRKIISMNAEFLSEQEVIRVTNEEFISIDREDLAGNYDLKLSISTAEADNDKAQELAFMLQTGAADADPAEVRMIRAEIARLRKMPELARKIESFEPTPDPLMQEKAQLEIALLKAQIAKEESQTQENLAEAELDKARAHKLLAETDKSTLDFVEQESGVTQERELQRAKAQAEGNKELKILDSVLKQNTVN